MWETWVPSLGQEDLLEKGMATHSSILAERMPWTEEHGRLLSMGSKRVGQDWAADTFTFFTVICPPQSLRPSHTLLAPRSPMPTSPFSSSVPAPQFQSSRFYIYVLIGHMDFSLSDSLHSVWQTLTASHRPQCCGRKPGVSQSDLLTQEGVGTEQVVPVSASGVGRGQPENAEGSRKSRRGLWLGRCVWGRTSSRG